MKESSNAGIEAYMDLLNHSPDNDELKKKMKRVKKRIVFWESILRALRKTTQLGLMIEFALHRDWLDFTVNDLQDWLKCNHKAKEDVDFDFNQFAHTMLQSCERQLPPTIAMFRKKDPDNFKDSLGLKKKYVFVPQFKDNLKIFFNHLIPSKQQWPQEKEKNLPNSPSEPI